MVETMKRKVKKIVSKKEIVELKITLDAEFFDNMDMAKTQVAEQRGYDITYGEYIQEAMEDLVKMVGQLSEELQKMSTEKQFKSLLPEVKDNNPAPVEEETEEEAYQREMQKFVEVAEDEVMYG